MTRRRFTAAIAAILSTSGCVGRRWWEDDTGDDRNDSPEGTTPENKNKNNTTGSRSNETEQAPADNPPSDSGPNESAERSERDDSEESEAANDEPEVHNESELHPDDDATTPSGEYNDSASGTPRDLSERPREHIELSNGEMRREYGEIVLTADITNVTADTIDIIDIRVTYSRNGEYLYGDTRTLSDLGGGETKQFTSRAPINLPPEEIDTPDIEATPYDEG